MVSDELDRKPKYFWHDPEECTFDVCETRVFVVVHDISSDPSGDRHVYDWGVSIATFHKRCIWVLECLVPILKDDHPLRKRHIAQVLYISITCWDHICV